jgi:PAS domain S-box-containing protein
VAGVEAERAHAAKVQDALYRIAELASAAEDMQEFYRAVHEVVGELIDARNLYIALYDDERQLINYPYWADELDTDWPEPNDWVEFGERQARGVTGYVLRTGEPQLLSYQRYKQLIGQGEIELVGAMTEDSSWLGVPLKADARTVGVLAVQSYTKEVQYTEQDRDLLAFVGQHIGAALSRARAIEETRQRNAELALINSVQEALAGELEMQAIYDVVGDKIHEIFDAQGVSIRILDEAAGLVSFPYMIERGERLWPEPRSLGIGFTKHVLETREPLMINEDVAAEAERYGSVLVAGEWQKSMLFVPLISGNRATGVIALDNFDREHAFSESDQRLLVTLAGGLSVALENARLVHETRQRNAELALINSVQEALAGELEMQSIYDIVGDKIQEIFDAQGTCIAMLDETTGLVSFPYLLELGERLRPEPRALSAGFTKHVLETREPLMINEDLDAEAERYGSTIVAGEMAKSTLFVPLVLGGRATGAISLDNLEREHAFTDADQRLLTTLAGSLSVALENARLVHETRQRNAELALINGAQEAIAGELDMQAIYDAVGDRIREIFNAQALSIRWLDESTGLLHFPYIIERGKRWENEPEPPAGFAKHVLETGEPLRITENLDAEAERYGSTILSGEWPKSVLFVPLITGGRATGVVALQDVDHEHAFSESDQQLLETLAASLSSALENARLVHETRQRNAELALINSVQEALAGELEQQAIYDAVGDGIRDVFDAQAVGISMLDESTGLMNDNYFIERGERLYPEPWEPRGFTKHVLGTLEPLLVTENLRAESERYESEVFEGSEEPKSVLFVPLAVGRRATGVISLQNVDRERAFSESDERLLETLAGSLSVALENARLVHETRQRNAELALINSVQDALAGELELQAIYDAVGERVRDVFDAQVVDIAMYNEASGLLHFPYAIERGERLWEEPIEIRGFRKHVIETREPLLINNDAAEAAERYGNPVMLGEVSKSVLFVPLIVGARATGVISLQNVDREHAFSESDQQLLATLASSLSVALENARLVHETRQRNAELALINSVQEALAGELEMQAIYDVVGDKIQEIFDAQVVDIGIFDFAAGLTRYPYAIERGVRFPDEPQPMTSLITSELLETKAPILMNDAPAWFHERGRDPSTPQGEPALAVVVAPLISGDEIRGRISLQNLDRTNAFSENDVRLLTTLAGSLSVALENARLVHETRQRNAELALINGVQEAIAGELDPQAIYDAVGDRIQEIFDAQVVSIATFDESTGLMNNPYIIERGERLDAEIEPAPSAGFEQHVMETREPILVTENVEAEAERYGSEVVVGEMAKSVLFVPLVTAGKATGVISLQNIDREHAFSDSDQQLLETLAGSLSVALENARLVHETRQRNAELALINGVQEAIAGELDPQAIYDAVGDRIREIFDAQAVQIRTLDEASGLLHTPYIIERGERLELEPSPGFGFSKHVLETRETVLIAENVAAEMERYGSMVVAGDSPKSILFVPLVTGGKATGVISLQNIDREHAFGESDRQLLETLAGSLSVALENARLVHETRQRNAELALINNVQDAIAGELDPQAIYDAVGDEIQEIFEAQAVMIFTLDEATGLMHVPYMIERGERQQVDPMSPVGFSKHVLKSRKSLLLTENLDAESERYGSPTVAGDDPKSVLFVPLLTGGKATGVISLQNVDREHAFSESDQQLLETLAGSLSVALENARLVHETRQRNAELALINGVQEAIAGELDPQAIYDAVGERIRDVFDAQVVAIVTLDSATGLVHYPYTIELGERLQVDPQLPGGFAKHVLETRESLLVNEDVEAVAERYGSKTMAGEDTKSVLFVPLVTGGKATGVISLQNVDHEHAFGDSDQQLLETLAGSLSVALENARLVHETRQRNAELALINGVQEAIAGELDPQAIYDAVGDRIRDVFDAQAVNIVTFDEATGLLHYPYMIERGERLQVEAREPRGFSKHVLETREPLLIVENLEVERERYGGGVVAGEPAKSVLFVPLVTGGRATGVISLQNIDREHAFDEDDKRLLTTLAGSLTVALENARLVEETQQRNAELALINSVQDAIAGELDPQAIYDHVGEKLLEVFTAQAVDIGVHDEDAEILRFVYGVERGVHFPNLTMPVVGFRKHVMESREPLYIAEDMDAALVEYGNPETVRGEPSHGSAIFQPLVLGGRAIGVISIQNLDREHAFIESDRRLLATIVGSLGVALENAQLIQETRQRVGELATVNSVGQALASQLELDALIELVGERVRETFDADIAFVALLDEAAGQIEFPYNYESGERQPVASMEYGEGLTSHILRSREPLLLNRKEQHEPQESVGTPSLSFLGVPILVGDKAIGVISVQSIEEEGRFGEADVRLLGTIAANVGSAIHNARLFAEVERQREYSASLVEISPTAVIVMDRHEVVTEWNPAAGELFGYSPEEALGRDINDLVFGDGPREEGAEITREAMATGRAQRLTRRIRKDGTPLDVELMLVPLVVEGTHSGFLGIYHDVTELQRAREEAEAATQAKSAFLATMSHEIRTPMNAVIGMTDLLLGTDLTGEQREFAEVVHSSGDALLHVIDDILDYSKIEAGKLDLERQPFSLRDCLEGALDIVAPRAWEKEIELGCLIDEAAPAGIVGDEARLRQVLLNLLSNAVKFTEAGEVFVLVDAEETGAGTFRVELAVRDTGIGIPPDRMDRLFTSFSQVDASTTRKFGGTGLGLAISKRLVELMGGTISVESKQQKGSTFRILLPVTEVDVPAKIAVEDGLVHLSGKRILVVDDNATNREIVTRHARSWEMEPVAVEYPTAALDLIDKGEPFDIAVLDMMMPGMDGLALAGEIRSRRSAEELPLLLLTSLGHLPQAESSVFSAQLAKPFKASQLYNTLLRLLTPGGAVEEEVEPVTDGKRARSALRILLAEDNPMNQKVALRLLEQLGYRADVATNGLEAIEALERQPYDVVLMDVQMPELDGLDATRRICEQWPEESRPHIIAMTANALPEDREACFAAGMNDYVAKPIRAEELVAALKRAKPLSSNGAGREDGGLELDAAALGQLRDLGGDEFLGEVIDAFLGDAPELIATLRRSLEEQSAEELRRAAHTLKSNGATLGAAEFAELCRNLEQRAKDGELDGASELVDRIEQQYGPLRDALTALRSEPVS